MPRFFCPACWHDFAEDLVHCPNCGTEILTFWDSKDRVEKLVLALHHPEPTTPVRAAWLLGKTGDPRAVAALIETIRSTEDIYLARAAVRALGETSSPEAMRFLESLSHHPLKMIRRDALKILKGSKGVG